jgi:hypothetical protein
VQQLHRRDDEEEVMVFGDWTVTRGGRRFRQRVADGLSHEQWRRMIRETYPARLDQVGPDWAHRFGQEVDWTVTEAYAEAQREAWARRTVVAAGKSWATHMAKFSGAVLPRSTPRRGRGICSGWADEEDYGPRYT